jgi:hypothetical protein
MPTREAQGQWVPQPANARFCAVRFIHRFGDALNDHIH